MLDEVYAAARGAGADERCAAEITRRVLLARSVHPEALAALDNTAGIAMEALARRLAQTAGAQQLRHLGVTEDALETCVREAFGRDAGFQAGWLTFFIRATSAAAALNVFTDYLGPLAPALADGAGRIATMTVVLAVIRGLLIDLDATGDAVRTDHAFHDFLTTIENA